MATGKENCAVKCRKNSGRPSTISRTMINIEDHAEIMTRIRCTSCSMKKKKPELSKCVKCAIYHC